MISSRGLDCTGNQIHWLWPIKPTNTLAMFELLWQSQNRKAFSSFPISACSRRLLLNSPHLQKVLTRYSDKEKDPKNGHWPVSKNVANFIHKNWGALPLCAGYVIMQTKRDKSWWRLLLSNIERGEKAEVNDSFNADVRRKVKDGWQKVTG